VGGEAPVTPVSKPLALSYKPCDNRHQREEGNEDEGGFEEGNEEGNEGGKASLTPLWRFVTKLEGGRGGGTTKFVCQHDCH
jgi:hypothetical protein